MSAVKAAQAQGGGRIMNWPGVARAVGGGRTPMAVRERWYERLNPELKLGRFTKSEDGVLRGVVTRWGKDWVRAAAALPGRSRTVCLQRWLAIVPGKRFGPWSEEEDERLLEVRARLVERLGEGEVTSGDLAEELGGGRNRIQCGRRFKVLMRKAQREATAEATAGKSVDAEAKAKSSTRDARKGRRRTLSGG